MAETVRFDDGAAYERMMGGWSRLAGGVFLDWIACEPGLSWVDVGCGNGAFTELIVARCAPRDVHGVDPSEGQLAFARTRPGAHKAQFQQGDAMNLPFDDGAFGVATMALVLFFVPEPEKGIAEMVRVVRAGGTIAAYMWDMPGGGFPHAAMLESMRAMGLKPPEPPSADASRLERMRELWLQAGLRDVDTRTVAVERTFANFEEIWATLLILPSVAGALASLAAGGVEDLKTRVRDRLPADANGRVTVTARAHAAKGRVPA